MYFDYKNYKPCGISNSNDRRSCNPEVPGSALSAYVLFGGDGTIACVNDGSVHSSTTEGKGGVKSIFVSVATASIPKSR